MDLSDIKSGFNRAAALTFSRKKIMLVFTILALCGLLVVFFRALALHAGQWVSLSLSFLPVFLCASFLLATGVILVRVYHDEVKQKPFRYRDVVAKSWEVAIGSSYFSIPIILCYLLLWMLLGIFLLLKEIPGIGEFFAVILAFGPFLINFGSLVLGVLSLSMLFVVAPVIALKGLNRIKVSQVVMRRLRGDLFSNLLLGLIALLPLLLCLLVLSLAAFLTENVCYSCRDPIYHIIQLFIIMIPFTALLAPAVIFFFNFATEAHILIQRNLR